jgi:hypothetical protein
VHQVQLSRKHRYADSRLLGDSLEGCGGHGGILPCSGFLCGVSG